MRERLALPLVALTVTILVLAPLAAPGYVLIYDMVFVPRQPLRPELLLPSAALPRAVPLDAIVSLATLAAPGWLVQRFALAAILLLAAIGAGRLVPAGRLGPRLVAAVGYAWTPYLAERLLIGQWGLLLAYAALPWLVGAALARRWTALFLAAALAAITPTGGLIALAVTAVLLLRRDSWRSGLPAIAGVAALNAPWLIAAALTSADGRSDPAGVAAFAARGADWTGPLGALASSGGIWNAQTTLPSRSSVLAPIGTLAVLGLAAFGWRLLRDRWPSGAAVRLLFLAAAGFVLAAVTMLPGGGAALGWLVSHVPGAGIVRDAQKFLIPYALLLCLAAALGAERLAARVPGPGGRVLLAGALLLPVAVQPDLAYGAANRLRPVAYPADWNVVAERIARQPGEVVSLPFAAYRTYPWNAGRTVLDPLPRYVDSDVLVDDRLVVGGVVVEGDDRRAAAVRRGVRWVVVQRVAGGFQVPSAALAGFRLVHAGIDLQLYQNGSSQESY